MLRVLLLKSSPIYFSKHPLPLRVILRMPCWRYTTFCDMLSADCCVTSLCWILWRVFYGLIWPLFVNGHTITSCISLVWLDIRETRDKLWCCDLKFDALWHCASRWLAHVHSVTLFSRWLAIYVLRHLFACCDTVFRWDLAFTCCGTAAGDGVDAQRPAAHLQRLQTTPGQGIVSNFHCLQ